MQIAIALKMVSQGLAEVQIPANSGTINTGNEHGGTFPATQRCGDDATWDIQEVVGGIEVEFTFAVQGNAKKVKVKGKSSSEQDYIVRAWNGVSWDEIQTVTINTVDNTYTTALSSAYTIDGQVRAQVYRAAGNNEILYLDCVAVLADATATPDADALLLESGSYLLLETGDFLLLE